MNDNPTNDAFEDPLEDYEPKTYNDPLERAIAEESVTQIQHQPHTSIGPDMTVAAAVAKLASEHVACLLVEEDGKLLGLFTHREVLNKVALEEGVLDQPVREVMTADPIFVREDDPIAATLCVMALHEYRHVPILGGDEKVLGIVSPQRVTKFLSKHLGA
jgi:predicted transcriptional regulator